MKTEIVEKKKRVLSPMRFVNATHNFTPLQEDFIFLIQGEMGKAKKIKTSVKIDLRDYINSKGLDIKKIRSRKYDILCKELLHSIVSFKYFEYSSLVHYNLFKSMSVKDFYLHAEIIEEVAPLFYINSLKQNHFLDSVKGKKLSLPLFEESYDKFDTYSSLDQNVFLFGLKQSEEKVLYRKIISKRHKGKYKFEITKEEIYMLLGCGSFEEIEKTEDIFGVKRKDFIITKYKENSGWQNLRRKIDKWLKTINDHPDSGITFELNEKGNGFLTLKGRPTKYFYVTAIYDSVIEFNEEQNKYSDRLINHYKLSKKQAFNIVRDFSLEDIASRIKENLEVRKDRISKKEYYVSRKAVKEPKQKINNIARYIYGFVFEYNKKEA